jgi:hypothetical protein
MGKIRKNEIVVFPHTGGTPALFAYADDLELTTETGSFRKIGMQGTV